MMNLSNIKTDLGTFTVRPGSSDLKAIKEVIEKRGYERKDFKIEPGELWLDLGANIGTFSVYAASKGAAVVAYEPDPMNFQLLKMNVEQNQLRVGLKQVALVATDQPWLTLHINSKNGNYWRNSLYKEWQGGESVLVRCENYRKAIDDTVCVKMDIEGAEIPILLDWPLHLKPQKLVFEWSFDIDNDMTKYWRVLDKLNKIYDNVVTSRKFDKELKVFPSNYFPPCVSVYCWGVK